MMIQLPLELPESIFSALRLPPTELVRKRRAAAAAAAAVQWNAERRVSQEKAADIAGLGRTEFIDE